MTQKFDRDYALNIGIPMAQAAYDAMLGRQSQFTQGFFTSVTPIRASTNVGYHSAAAKAMVADTNTFGLIGRKADDLYVTFRGTESTQDWLQDFSVNITRDGTFGWVHDGFLDVYQLVRENVIHTVRSQLDDNTRITIIGHSLGGAMATLAAADISSELRVNASVLTFASPRVGMQEFETKFNRCIENCWHVTNFLDIVPHVPPFPYRHVGQRVRVNSGGPIDTVHRHNLASYATGLGKLTSNVALDRLNYQRPQVRTVPPRSPAE
jgi:predicted lipase